MTEYVLPEESRILIIKLSALGDVVHALPAARALRRALPKARIDWVVEEKARQAVEGNPDIDRVLVTRTRWWRRRPLSSLGEMVGVVAELRRARYDVAIDFQGLVKSGVVALLSGARLRLGYDREFCRERLSSLFTNRRWRPPSREQHVVEQHLGLLQAVGIQAEAEVPFSLPLSQEVDRVMNSYLDSLPGGPPERLVAIHPGAGWVTKRWPVERYARLADRIRRELGGRILILWGPGEESLAREMREKMREEGGIACSTSVPELISLFRRCSLLVAGDTGPLHLAAACGLPCVGIFGPTSPLRNGPYGVPSAVAHIPLPCSNCYGRTCRYDLRCLDALTVDEVFERVGAVAARLQWSGVEVSS